MHLLKRLTNLIDWLCKTPQSPKKRRLNPKEIDDFVYELIELRQQKEAAITKIYNERNNILKDEELKLYAQKREGIIMEVFALILAREIRESKLNRFILPEKEDKDDDANDK
jgi:hypothetical protein